MIKSKGMNLPRNYLKKEFKMLLFDSEKEQPDKDKEEKICIKVAFFVGFSVPFKSYL